MRPVLSVVALAVVAGLALAPSTARAGTIDVSLYMGCENSSKDPLRLQLVQNGAVVKDVKVTLDPTNCRGPNGRLGGPFTIDDSLPLDVRLTASGADGYQVQWLQAAYSPVVQQQGVEGGRGWCLSTDPKDDFGSDAQTGDCLNAQSFAFQPPTSLPVTVQIQYDCQKDGLKNTETANPLWYSFDAGPKHPFTSTSVVMDKCAGAMSIAPYTIQAQPGVTGMKVFAKFTATGDDAAWLDWVSFTYRATDWSGAVGVPLGPDGNSTCLATKPAANFYAEGEAVTDATKWDCHSSLSWTVPAPVWK